MACKYEIRTTGQYQQLEARKYPLELLSMSRDNSRPQHYCIAFCLANVQTKLRKLGTI